MKTEDVPAEKAEAVAFLDAHRGTLPEQLTAADLAILNEGLRFLFAGLGLGFRRRQLEGCDLAGLGEMLAALWRFIALFERPCREGLYVPLITHVGDLETLEQGFTPPALRPRVQDGRRARSGVARTTLRGYAAGTSLRLRLFETDGTRLSQKRADSQVAAVLNKHGLKPERSGKPEGGQFTDRTIRLWRDDIAAGRDADAAVIFEDMFSDVEQQRFELLASNEARRAKALELLARLIRAVAT
jgi:hypothetical protein